MTPDLRIEVFADVACPWCYIGLRRLERALSTMPELRVSRVWRPFQLQPELPAEGLDWSRFAQAKFGGVERMQSAFRHVVEAARDDDITFNLEGIARASNTLNAHRLILHARESEREWIVAEALFRAFFTEGRNLSDTATLVSIAEEAGLEPSRVRELLAGEKYVHDVASSQAEAVRARVTGVPFYVLGGRYALSGAQPVDTFVRALQVASDSRTITT